MVTGEMNSYTKETDKGLSFARIEMSCLGLSGCGDVTLLFSLNKARNSTCSGDVSLSLSLVALASIARITSKDST